MGAGSNRKIVAAAKMTSKESYISVDVVWVLGVVVSKGQLDHSPY